MPARRMRRIIMEFGVYLLLIISLGSTLFCLCQLCLMVWIRV